MAPDRTGGGSRFKQIKASLKSGKVSRQDLKELAAVVASIEKEVRNLKAVFPKG